MCLLHLNKRALNLLQAENCLGVVFKTLIVYLMMMMMIMICHEITRVTSHFKLCFHSALLSTSLKMRCCQLELITLCPKQSLPFLTRTLHVDHLSCIQSAAIYLFSIPIYCDCKPQDTFDSKEITLAHLEITDNRHTFGWFCQSLPCCTPLFIYFDRAACWALSALSKNQISWREED